MHVLKGSLLFLLSSFYIWMYVSSFFTYLHDIIYCDSLYSKLVVRTNVIHCASFN